MRALRPGVIRVNFDRDFGLVRGDHFHSLCRCGQEWLEQVSGAVVADG